MFLVVSVVVFVLVVVYVFVVMCFGLFPLSYSLWYQTSCPQPPQPNVIDPPRCQVGALSLVAADILPDQRLYTFTGSNLSDPLPYSSYQFQVGASNSEGNVISTLSPATTTFASGKITSLINLNVLTLSILTSHYPLTLSILTSH